jgi:hypothetical protein
MFLWLSPTFTFQKFTSRLSLLQSFFLYESSSFLTLANTIFKVVETLALIKYSPFTSPLDGPLHRMSMNYQVISYRRNVP